MRGALVGPVEHLPASQHRDQRAGAEAADDAGRGDYRERQPARRSQLARSSRRSGLRSGRRDLQSCHCEERLDEKHLGGRVSSRDCFAALAIATGRPDAPPAPASLGALGLAPQRPAHRGAARPGRAAQHDLLGFAQLRRSRDRRSRRGSSRRRPRAAARPRRSAAAARPPPRPRPARPATAGCR